MARLSSPPLDVMSGRTPFSLRYPPGHRIAGKYQLIRTLEAGGMGVVWVAHHIDLDVQVALKVLRNEGHEMAERLLREAQSAARIDHPAVVRVFDTGTTPEGDPFLVMELLDGEPLAAVLEREHRLDPVTAVRTLLPVVGALAAVHARGIIHRDIKPENIFLARDDSGRARPKIIDFGLTHLATSRITQPGVVMGTPAYMAPEQLRGDDPDALADVWSLVSVLYETICGARPIVGESYLEILTMSMTERIRPLMGHGVQEPALWAIIEQGLARSASRRPSAQDLGRALALWLWDRGVTDDIGGTSLRAGWLREDDVRRAPRSQVQTARFPFDPSVLPRLPALPPEPPSREASPEPPPAESPRPESVMPAPAGDTPARSAAPEVSSIAPALASMHPQARPPAAPRGKAMVVTAAVAAVAAVLLAVSWWRGGSAGVAPAAPVSAVAAPSVVSVTATVEAPAVSAIPAVSVAAASSAAPSASASAPPITPRPRVTPAVMMGDTPKPPARPPAGLKNPYQK